MDQSAAKSSVNQSDAAKKPEPVKFQVPTGFADELSKYPSVMDGILKFIFHPFILLGGIAVAIYFFYRARQSGSLGSAAENIDLNKELRAEIKALRKENKRLNNQLSLLQSDDEYDDLVVKRRLSSSGKKRIGVARLE
jgi:cell division protein FtsB